MNGIYTYNVDQKGRIVMPSRFLEEIGNPFVLAGTSGGYLVAASSPDKLESRNGIRSFVNCHIKDRTGRFVIPSALREYAELEQTGEAAVIGLGTEVEIWNKRRWESNARSASLPGTGKSRSAEPPFESWTQSEPTHFRQKALYGQPYLEVEGALTLDQTDRLLARLETMMRGRPRTIFLDLRKVDTIDAAFLLAMEPTSRQLAAQGGRLAILTERDDMATLIHRLCGSKSTRVFTNLEASLWWLVEEGHA